MKSPFGIVLVVVAVVGVSMALNRGHDKDIPLSQSQPESQRTAEAYGQVVDEQDHTLYGLTFTEAELEKLSQSELAELVNIRIREKNNADVERLLGRITVDLVSEGFYSAAMMSDNDEAIGLLFKQRVTISYTDLAWANKNSKKYMAILLNGACDEGVPYQSGGHEPCDSEVREQLLSN